jgi:hypothetical protein
MSAYSLLTQQEEEHMKKTTCVRMSASAVRFALVGIHALAVAILLCSCGGAAKAEDYGWFSYAPPEGWKRLDMSRDATSIAFLPSNAIRETGVNSVEISNVEWMKRVKKGELAATVIGDLKMHWEHDSKQAELQGKPPPPFNCEVIPALIKSPGQVDAFSIHLVRNDRPLRFLKHFIELPDGHRFIVEYSGSDPGYSEYLDAVKQSLKTIRFADTE